MKRYARNYGPWRERGRSGGSILNLRAQHNPQQHVSRAAPLPHSPPGKPYGKYTAYTVSDGAGLNRADVLSCAPNRGADPMEPIASPPLPKAHDLPPRQLRGVHPTMVRERSPTGDLIMRRLNAQERISEARYIWKLRAEISRSKRTARSSKTKASQVNL